MPLFSIPIDTSTARSSSRDKYHPRTSKKRKRHSSPQVDLSDGDTLPQSDPAPVPPSFTAASTNPLSLTPNEIHQYKVAGLDLDQELPSQYVSDFPHRGLPSLFITTSQTDSAGQTDGDGTGTDSEGPKRGPKQPHLRMQHLSVLTTVLHRCLLEGDIQRASRAWAMLLRTQVDGKGINIRSSGYWGIGAELLIRSNEQLPRGRNVRKNNHSQSSKSGSSENSDIEDDKHLPENAEVSEKAEWLWGTPSSLEKVKDYYERLILQYPYKRQFHNSINPLDFWPAMLSCEIYGIQAQQKANLRTLVSLAEDHDSSLLSDISDEDELPSAMDPDAYFAAQQRTEGRKEDRRREILWQKSDEIRQTALLAAEKVAARMDELMATPPYSDSHVLYRLRGMLSLYIGDLSVAALYEVEDEEGKEGEVRGGQYDEEGAGDMFVSRNGRSHWQSREEMAERRLLERRRKREHERGVLRRNEEREKALRAFDRVVKEGGTVGVAMDDWNIG